MSDNNFTDKQIVSGIGWKLLERLVSQAITLIVTIVLARILDPMEYGLIALVTVFVAILNIFVTSGIADSLIQKQDADELDFTSMFWLNFIISLFMYFILFCLAPIIADFYGYYELIDLIRVLSIGIIISALNIVQHAYLLRRMMFRNYFFITFSSKVISGVTGVVMAITGYGVWALVAQSLAMTVTTCLALWWNIRWIPKLYFSLIRVKVLYSYGWKILIYQLAETTSNHLRIFFIGKSYSASELAYYNRGTDFPNLLSSNIVSTISSVMFPVFSNLQNDILVMKKYVRQTVSITAYCIFPLLTGLAIMAKPLILSLFTVKWLMSVQFLQIACISYLFWVLEIPMKICLNALGKSSATMFIEITKAIITVGLVWFFLNWGILFVALTTVLSSLYSFLVYALCLKYKINYQYHELLNDILPPILLSIPMCICMFGVMFVQLEYYYILILQIIIGICIYIIFSHVFQVKCWSQLMNIVVNKFLYKM